ncbi:Retrovirus-related Pol polyprotein from transposon 17.6,Transposon Ty3-I Gag-Pol polyprotein,Transposon Ty3-G Gag-Pol polyprotein,Retrovirus-related Pol polyprotein from transposon 297 [Mytilus edulis]|uniref:Retrovirus-related Pol polyprotein from transposon 17.6,Transposon Ty3-I Gag-Pol polyprotein,Transposon Ty3-G Gag-Pol polyprotein,Retrovirus-related Pol polyprotein from transposon 297 n=1 Tax=Mytilus edulis TaxID=6550 RepID=A0A8S3V8H7_MYTED|nr:Retrovirus-related Pol polyprotein from transposon 17.6,Transposon Ty3-I Gag-Pol polyprotein,Transposon Ty3-G Gag-Pol polyprotein,Retrovirus-related Pol polyprotein from transposon 297 [Mytilus edulis]
MVKQNIIRKSNSPYAAPIVIVRKPDSSIRLCTDFRQLNQKTVRDTYPLPRIEEALDALHGTKYYTTLDLAQGYYQVAMEPDDIAKTTFRVGTGGLYEYLHMPMGLSNSAATFQRLMEACFNDKNFEILLIYLDDILIFSRTIEEQIERLEFAFERLRKHGLKMKTSRCHLFRTCYISRGNKN